VFRITSTAWPRQPPADQRVLRGGAAGVPGLSLPTVHPEGAGREVAAVPEKRKRRLRALWLRSESDPVRSRTGGLPPDRGTGDGRSRPARGDRVPVFQRRLPGIAGNRVEVVKTR